MHPPHPSPKSATVPRSSFGIRPLLIFSLLSLRTSPYFQQPLAANVLKITRFLVELPLFWHFVSFEQLANGSILFWRPLVRHSISSLFSGWISVVVCHAVLFHINWFVWTIQFKLKNFNCRLPRPTGWRLQSFAGAPAVNSITEGFCNKHLHFQNTVYCPNAIIVNSLSRLF